MGLTPEQEARADRIFAEASELDRRRYDRLDGPDKWGVLSLVPSGEYATLGEAVTRVESEGGFDQFMAAKRGRDAGVPAPDPERQRKDHEGPR